MTFSETPSVFDQRGSMVGNWEDLSFGKLNDYPEMAFRMALPYTYDLRHLPENISQEQRWIAEGKACFEQYTLLYAGAKGLQSMQSFKFASYKTFKAPIGEAASVLGKTEIISAEESIHQSSNIARFTEHGMQCS